ncbi:MAG: bifunctional 5,10-methylenetetrahydrofolate dehydrogenase/5,10-methenyltetrahydrofolate cyclohydrolase [Actinomycetales bacterium]
MAKLLDGRAAAKAIKESLATRVAKLPTPPVLGTILVGSDPASVSYINGKHRDCAEIGIKSLRVELPESATKVEILAAVERLNSEKSCTGFLVQLPLPDGVEVGSIMSAVDPTKDVDGLHPINLGRLTLDQPGVRPCTPLGIIELLRQNQIELAGREVVVIGRGATVGRPLALMLAARSINATVTTVHSKTRNIAAHTKRAEIVISAVGSPNLLTPEMISPGAVIVDVGLTRTDAGLVGDVAPGVSEVAGWITPVPGGVGPMTRAMLLRNLLELAEK